MSVLAEKRAQVAKQLRQAWTAHVKVTCGCGLTLPLMLSYRCLYCGEFYCRRCAEVHFGTPRAQYEHERADVAHLEERAA